MKKIISLSHLLVVFGWLGVASALLGANSVVVSPSATTYNASGGSVTFTVTLAYTEAMSGLGLDVSTPSGWKFVSAAGTNVPQLLPPANDLGPYNFNYQTVPASPVTFNFTLSYPAGKTGSQTLSSIAATFGADSGAIVTVPHANITLTPITQPPSVTVNQASIQADPTSSSPINFTVVFSESVTGFDGADVSLSGTAGGTIKTVAGSGATYNVAISGMTGSGRLTSILRRARSLP